MSDLSWFYVPLVTLTLGALVLTAAWSVFVSMVRA
jgi:type II secretory pathway component PulJ